LRLFRLTAQTVAKTAPAPPEADQPRRCDPDGVFGQTNGMRAGVGEFRVMSTCVGFLPQVRHVSRSIACAIC
jgi:hypothetical protein